MELKTLQKALEKETASAVAQSRASDAIGPLMGTLQRAMEEQGNALAPLMMKTAQSIARQFTEPMIATNALSGMIRSISEEHQSMFARLRESTAADTSRWFAEAGIASSAFTEAINRSAEESWLSTESRLAQIVEDVNKNFQEAFMPHADKMIADLVGQTSSFKAMETAIAQHEARMRDTLERTQDPFQSRLIDREYLRPVLPSNLDWAPSPKQVESGAFEFKQILDEHVQKATKQAEETGGQVLMKCTLPGGEILSNSQISPEDDYFVSVSGTDEYGQCRSLTVDFRAVLITIEVVCSDETEEVGDDMPIN